MKPIHPIIAMAGAAAVLATGYAWGAAVNSPTDSFINVKLLTTSGVRFVEGPDADPPPWPENGAKAPPPRPSAMAAAANALAMAPPDSPMIDTSRGTVALNIPSSATNPIYKPPSDPTASSPTSPPRDGTRRRPRRSALQPNMTYGTTHEGRQVTIVWDGQ